MVVQSLPLAESLFNEHFETADLLLEHGASGDVTRGTAALDPFDQYVGVNIKPSLHMAIDSKNYYLLHRLLRAGANPCEEQVNETKEAHISALGYSLLGKEYKALEIILEGGGSPNSQFTVDANYYPYFPVEYAAEKHDWKALQILLSFNPDLELICEDGWSLRVVISKAYAANAAQLSC
jgi:ankyrin repeat protein